MNLKNPIYILLFVLFLAPGLCLSVNLDSLWGVWNDKSQPDTNRLKAMSKIASDGYVYSQPDSAFYFAQLQYDFAESVNNKKWMASALTIQGASFYLRGDYVKAINYYAISLKIKEAIEDISGISQTLNNIGIIYKIQGDYDKAMDHYIRFLKISEKLEDKKSIAVALNNMGNIYHIQDNYDKAMEYYNSSLTITEELGDKRGKALALNNIGLIYNEQGDYNKAIEYHTKGLTMDEELGDKNGLAGSLINIGHIYKAQGDYAKAMDYYTRCLKIYEELEHKQGISSSLNFIGIIYKNQGDYAQALDYSSKALYLAQEVGAVRVIEEASGNLWELHEKLGKHRQALKMHQLYIEMRDSITSIENKEAIIKQEFKYQYEKEQALADAKHQEELALSAEREKRQQLLAISAGAGLVMVLAFAFFIFNRLRVTRRQKKVIEEQKELVEEQKKDITDSIRYAENIQRALLPTHQSINALLPDSFIFFQPKDVVSGDFYWMQHHNEQVYLAACDCTGHGVPGAFMSMIGSSQLDEAVIEKGIAKPNEIFYEVRKGFINALKQTAEAGQQKDGMDASLIAWDKKNKLQYAAANNPIFLIRNGELLETKPDRQPVGFHLDNSQPYTHHELQLEKGDTIYLFSDGYPDQFGGEKTKKFMKKNFKKLLLSIQDKTMHEQRDILKDTMRKWKGETDQVDDILVMGVRF